VILHPFKSEIYYAVTGDVEGANNTTLTGTFSAGVFDGPYNSIPRYIKEMEKRLASENKKAKDYYIHYAYCPKMCKEIRTQLHDIICRGVSYL
jgi:hypothetical protein